MLGEVWKGPGAKALRRLGLIQAGIRCRSPVHVLALRIVLGCALSFLDHLHTSHRCGWAALARCQQLWMEPGPCEVPPLE